MKDSRKTTVESHIFSYNKLIMDIEERMDNAEEGSKKMLRLEKNLKNAEEKLESLMTEEEEISKDLEGIE